MNPLNGNELASIYTSLGIRLDSLGCIMLDVSNDIIPDFPSWDDLYVSPDPVKFWINGFVANETPHVTVLYGLMQSGNNWKKYVNDIIRGWNISSVTIKEVGYFNSPYPDEPYYCIIAHLDISPELQAMHDRLRVLPHVDTNPGFKAHITIAYIKNDPLVRDNVIGYYNSRLAGKELDVLGLNYGDKK